MSVASYRHAGGVLPSAGHGNFHSACDWVMIRAALINGPKYAAHIACRNPTPRCLRQNQIPNPRSPALPGRINPVQMSCRKSIRVHFVRDRFETQSRQSQFQPRIVQKLTVLAIRIGTQVLHGVRTVAIDADPAYAAYSSVRSTGTLDDPVLDPSALSCRVRFMFCMPQRK